MSHANSARLPEIERWFDVTVPVDLCWFERYFELLAQYSTNPHDIRCEIWMDAASDERRVIFHDRKSVLDFVAQNWNHIEETVVIQYVGPVRYGLLNHQHHSVRIRTERTYDTTVDEVFSTFQVGLSLSPSEPFPYKYRRSSIEYEIGQWNPKGLAAGMRNIANLIGPNPYVDRAYVKSFDGDVEKLIPFFDLQSFLEHIDRRVSTFGEITLLLRARSTTVGISVPSDHKKLRIRTSIASNDLDPIMDAWPKELRLKPVKAEDSGDFFSGGDPARSNEKTFVKYGVPIITAFITAFSVASAITLKKAIWPDYKIVITSPTSENGNATTYGQQVLVDWYLQPDQQSFRTVIKDAVATVRLRNSAGQLREVTSRPPVSLDVSPGDYAVIVDADDIAPSTIQLKIHTEEKTRSLTGKK